MIGGSGALGTLGIIPMPIGTLDELRKEGINPSMAGSCAPSAGLPGHEAGVRGCPVWDRCPFHLKRNGGFKGKGPRNVGYFLQTHEGHKKEDFMRCYDFVATLLGRMRAGQRDREEGKPGEIVDIIAQEGEKIAVKYVVPENEANKSLSAPYKFFRDLIAVPELARPSSDISLEHDQMLTKRQQERQKKNPDYETGVPPRIDLKADKEKYQDQGGKA